MPFFIVGCPRSGTTLLQVLLEHHPRVAIPPESFVFERFGPILDRYGNLECDANLRAFVCDLLCDEQIRDWQLGLDVDEFCQRSFPRNAAGVISELFKIYAEKHGKTRWGDKTPQHALCLPTIISVFPAARIIHLVRDGRDVAESMRRIYIGPKSMYGIARRWHRFVMTVHSFAVQYPDSVLIVRYEDMVREPEETRKRVFRFIGVPPEECPPVGASLPDTPSRRQALAAAEHHVSLRQAISQAKSGVFKRSFTLREIGWFESVAGEALRHYGYELVTDGKQRPSLLRRMVFLVEDRVVRYVRKFRQPRALFHIGKELRLVWQHRLRLLRHGRL